ncbi:hypothetical protein V8E55_005927 [Tylopilus felleus]
MLQFSAIIAALERVFSFLLGASIVSYESHRLSLRCISKNGPGKGGLTTSKESPFYGTAMRWHQIKEIITADGEV